MDQNPDRNKAQERENPDPSEMGRPIPLVVLGVIALALAWALAYIFIRNPNDPAMLGDSRQASELTTGRAAGGSANGAQVFVAQCVACHQATGAGLPGVFPPLAGSERVNAAAVLPVSIVLHGIGGKITTKAGTFNGSMPTFKDKLSDEEIAAVLTHVRANFGNNAGKIIAADVKAVRDATKDRTTPWGGDDELAAIK